MVLEFYDKPASPPCRAVKLTLKALNLDYKLHPIDALNKEHLSDHYLKMNPQHTFPLLTDDDFVVWDSHAINGYLVDKYGGTDNSLYPKDPQKRAKIDQRLFFECELLFTPTRRIVTAILTGNAISANETEVNNLKDAYNFVEKFLSSHGGTAKYIAIDQLTIADFSFVSTMSTINLIVPDFNNKEKYPLTNDYLTRCKQTVAGYEEINEKGLTQFKETLNRLNFKF